MKTEWRRFVVLEEFGIRRDSLSFLQHRREVLGRARGEHVRRGRAGRRAYEPLVELGVDEPGFEVLVHLQDVVLYRERDGRFGACARRLCGVHF